MLFHTLRLLLYLMLFIDTTRHKVSQGDNVMEPGREALSVTEPARDTVSITELVRETMYVTKLFIESRSDAPASYVIESDKDFITYLFKSKLYYFNMSKICNKV